MSTTAWTVASVTNDWHGAYLEHLHRLARLSVEEERAEYRRRVTAHDPLLFALLYLRKHLRMAGDVTLSEVHHEWIERAALWADGTPSEPGRDRDAYLAPRGLGKSTWWFLVLPLWAGAHGHVGFFAAFADTSAQAEAHLATLKVELDHNPLLRFDFPDLVAPLVRPASGASVADNRSQYQARSGFVFAARGVDTGNLGMKVGEKRPDIIICDDLEPGESNYSAYQAEKRRGTLIDDILALNVYARVVLVGTTTMSGSITDQLREAYEAMARGEELPESVAWVAEQHFRVHLTPAIATNDDGSRRSIWPEKWSLPWLEERERTREFQKNYALSPLGADGGFWTIDDIERGRLERMTHIVVSVDPAVTTKGKSDYTGIAVIAFDSVSKRCAVLEVQQVKLVGEGLRDKVIAMLDRWDAGLVLVETNQGGDLWPIVFHHMPVKVKTVHQSVSKEDRAADALAHYQRHRVLHLEGAPLADFEAQLVAFPKAAHDDMVDAVTSGVRYFLSRGRTKRVVAGGVSVPYAA